MSDTKAAIEAFLQGGLDSVLEGSKEDIRAYGVQIMDQMARAAAAGDADVQRSLLAQLKALGGRQKVRASAAAWAGLDVAIDAVAAALLKV